MIKRNVIAPIEKATQAILLIRGQRVVLDTDLAALYGVETGQFNRAVKRNLKRFPKDFMFQLTKGEFKNLKCQIGISSQWGGRRSPPYAFSEHGAIMAATILNSRKAVEVSVFIVRAFIKIRQLTLDNTAMAARMAKVEATVAGHGQTIDRVVLVLRELMEAPGDEPEESKDRMGFKKKKKKKAK